MQQASKCFSEADRQRINDGVRTAEIKTSAELVPVVVTSSGRYDRAEDMIGLWTGLALMILISMFWPAPLQSTESGSWGPDPGTVQTVKLITVMIAGFFLGAIIGARISCLRRLFTPTVQMADKVNQTAQSVFFDKRVHHTQCAGGILIYVSLFERIAVILADQSVLQAVGQPALDELCRSLTQNLRQNGPTEAICQAIQAAGEKLAIALPRLASDANELPDSLVTIDSSHL